VVMRCRLPWPATQWGGQKLPRQFVLLCWASVVTVLMSACAVTSTAPTLGGPLRPPPSAAVIAPGLTALPRLLPFPIEQNVGQAGPGVGFLLRAGEMQVGFGAGELTYVLSGPGAFSSVGSDGWRPASPAFAPERQVWTVRQELVGASQAMPSGTVGSPTTVSYFKGGPEEWLVGVPAFQQVTYAEAWSGISVTFDQSDGGFKSAYHVATGAAPGQIRLLYSGARVRVDEAGMLVAETPLGELRESPPVAWQERDGTRVMVSVRFELLGATTTDGTEYGFALGPYDPELPLVIDPQLVYASFIGGSGSDQGRAIALDGAGNVYLTGLVDAPGTTFPGGPATFDSSHNGDWDAFVAKLNPAGTALLYASFIGGSGQEIGFGIAVDGTGNAYVAGLSGSSETTFPTGSGVGGLATFDGTFNGGGGDAFVAKVNPAGTALLYAGFLGGNGYDQAQGIAVDAAGNAYVSGHTQSSEATFPNGNGMGSLPTVDGTFNAGGGDAFVAKVNPAGTSLVYAGYIGGNGYDHGSRVAVDGAGNAYVAGRTESSEATFPNGSGMGSLTTFAGVYSGISDVFVVKVNQAGTALSFAGYVGGSGSDKGGEIALDGAGNIYVGGSVEAPLSPALLAGGSVPMFDSSYNGSIDGFVVKLNPAGTAVLYAGYIGGNGDDSVVAIAVDTAGVAYVTGYTNSSEATFPNGNGMGSLSTYDATNNGGGDMFVAKLNVAGTALAYAGFLGGNGIDVNPPWSTETGIGIAVDQAGNAYVTGRTNSSEATFPDGLGMSGMPTFDSSYGGGQTDAIVVKVTGGATCALAGRQASAGLTYATYAYQYAYYDYIVYGNLNSYYALAYQYQAYLNSQAGYSALTSGNFAAAKTSFNAAATYADSGYQYAYAAYTSTNSIYAYYAYAYGYHSWIYETQAFVSC
jgi:hypothetical protein